MKKNYLAYSYEIIDARKNVGSEKLGYVGIARYCSDGLIFYTIGGKWGISVECDIWEDDDDGPTLSVDNEAGKVVIRTPKGDVTLMRLGLANFKDSVYPFLPENMKLPDFKTDDAVNAFFANPDLYRE